MTTPDTRLKLNEGFVWEPMNDGCILYCQSTGQIITINPTAELILTYCDGETPLNEVYQAVIEDAPMDESAFQSSITKFLEEKVLIPVTA